MKIPVHNPGQTAIFVGALMIAAGDTRMIEEEDVPEHLKPGAQAEANSIVVDDGRKTDQGDDTAAGATGNDTMTGAAGNDTMTGAAGNDSLPGAADVRRTELAELLDQSVGDVREAFATLNDEDLAVLKQLEEGAEKPRKSLIEAIAAEQLQRAGSSD